MTKTRRTLVVSGAVAVAFAFLFASRPASGFTQKGMATFLGAVVPIGHEWITEMASAELLASSWQPGRDDPRRNWTRGRSKNLDISEEGARQVAAGIRAQSCATESECKYYLAQYRPIYAAIVGQRWVDAGGFDIAREMAGKRNCFDAVSQEPVEAQYDHFMRRFDDLEAKGGVKAANESRGRFIEAFVRAAIAPPTIMRVFDGGGVAAATNVDRNFFLLGRAIHVFQDSFSAEHTVRVADDGYERVRQVKSFMCAKGSEQHSRGKQPVIDYTSGDVIWLTKTGAHVPSNMKNLPLAATEATKDLLAAFIRTMGTPLPGREAKARAEATKLADNWLSINVNEVLTWYDDESHRDDTYVRATGQSGRGQEVGACMAKIDNETRDPNVRARKLAEEQRFCLFNVIPQPGYSDLYDTNIHMWFNWKWKYATRWEKPPDDWPIPNRPADTGVRVKIKSLEGKRNYMTAYHGISEGKPIECRGETPPLVFIRVPTDHGDVYRVSSAILFLSYNLVGGAAKLHWSPQDADFQLRPATEGVGMWNWKYSNYLWLKDSIRPTLTSFGSPDRPNGRWSVEPAQP